MALNPNITLYKGRYYNTKASEEYVKVTFFYPESKSTWEGWVPVEYRRTGVSIPESDKESLEIYLTSIYEQMRPSKYPEWKKEQDKYWSMSRSTETKAIFYTLSDGKWHCRNCDISNANFARRIQDLKEFGYTISTQLGYQCPICGKARNTGLLLLPINRIELAGNGYETWSQSLRKRIINVLGGIDVYENTQNRNCLPDHKFSEIRWDDETKAENPDSMSDAEIRAKFQLLTNQRNQQKREVCRNCFQTGQRGTIYGISYYYKGGPLWDNSIPSKGKSAEEGCKGCPWYDIERWRNELMRELANKNVIQK